MPSFGKRSSEHRCQEVEVSKKLRSLKALKETVRHVYFLNLFCSWLFRPCKFFYCDTRVFTACIWWIRSDLACPLCPLRYAVTVYDRPEVVSLTEVKKIVTGLHDSCCAQICILFAFTKAIDLKLHLSLRFELTTSRQKHFSTRISFSATHQGSVKVSSKTKHLSCLELTPQKQLFMKILDNSNHAYMREVIQILWWIKSSQKWNSKRGKSALQQKEKTPPKNSTLCRTIPPSGA